MELNPPTISFGGVSGSFRDVCGLVKRLNDNPKINVTINTVFSQHNINEMEQVKQVIEELQPYQWRVASMIPIGRAYEHKELLLTPDQYKKMLNFIKNEHLNNKKVQMVLGCGDWLGFDYEGQVRDYIWKCLSGIAVMGILCDGSIGGCCNIERSINVQGNVRTDRIKDVWDNKFEIFRNLDFRKKGDCIDCDQWIFCKGGSMHNLLPDGNLTHCLYKIISEGKDYFCDLPKKVFDLDAGN